MTRKRHPSAMGFDLDGKPLSYSPDQVNDIVDKSFEDPDSHVVLVILQKGDDLMVQIMGEPSRAILNQLEQVVASYRKILRGQ